MKSTIIHHSADFDGIFCREIAKKFLPDADVIGWDYKDNKLDFPSEGMVYVLDLSPECFTTFDKDRLIWIDHHKSAIEKYPSNIPGYRIDGVAACRLTWDWFSCDEEYRKTPAKTLASKQHYIDRDVSEPYAVRLAGEYDIWDKRDPNAELFQHGLRSQDLDDGLWRLLLVEEGEHADGVVDCGTITARGLLEKGCAIQYARTKEDASIITHNGYTVKFEDLAFLVCNHARFNSLLFTAGVKPEHDALCGWRFDGKKYIISLYHAPGKEYHDLSQIAVKYGGGGHKGACGFTSNTLPF